ncbi:MAG: zinc-binding dehydrogenase, partial [Planctomycetales bacterium]|nr:zinc-binding dehydrogenase [Planctomycetales bacterium]
ALRASTQLTTLAPLYLVQAWEQRAGASAANLHLVTRGGQSQDGKPDQSEPAQAPLIGFGRVVASEYARFTTKLIDLPGQTSTSDLDHLLEELLADDGEDEVLWRAGRRFVHRFESLKGKQLATPAAHSMPCRLQVGSSAGVEELRYTTNENRQPQAGEVEISVLASGLNFSDVMKALDMYPGLPDGPVALGAECSGRITAVGPNSRWQVGDEVIAVAPGSFGTHVIVNDHLVARKPSNLTHEQAAAIPIAFLTADYALNHCARLQPGESVLIHSASGGVGLAAMQLAVLAGVKVLATAGTDEKRQLVREQGATYVMDSRSLDFADETMCATGGQGVDAVLNSLPGEAIAKGLMCLKTGGRFLEIGKRDIYGDATLGLYPFRNNLALFAIDLDQL